MPLIDSAGYDGERGRRWEALLKAARAFAEVARTDFQVKEARIDSTHGRAFVVRLEEVL